MSHDQEYIIKAGEIKTRESKRGIEFHAWSHERQRWIYIGTKSGRVYEKCTAILWRPKPSISLTQAELAAVEDSGADFLRCVFTDKPVTYSISLEDFKANAEPHDNAIYGGQWRVLLEKFTQIGAVTTRNAHLDNPTQARAEMNIPRQLSLFGGRQ